MKNTKVDKVGLFKSEFYVLNYKINSIIFKCNYHCHLNHKETKFIFLKWWFKISIYHKNNYLCQKKIIYVKIDYNVVYI